LGLGEGNFAAPHGGGRGHFLERLRAYGCTGKPCDRCGTPIKRIVVGQRSTHFCPQCQKRKN
jgi:formamidopyrimidine-DNA glycosylase